MPLFSSRYRAPRAWIGTAAALLVAAGCAPAAAPATAPTPAAALAPPRDVHWVRSSAEHRAIFEQTFTAAAQAVERLAAGRTPQSWAVILDADETILDNSVYQLRRAAVDSGFTPESWTAWVRERDATALPGAAPFVARVRSLGGRVVIVTNRTQAECDDTRSNIDALGMQADLVLCRSPESGDKNARFQSVERGTAAPGWTPATVLIYVGDNIQDFPGMTQGARDGGPEHFARFGRDWFILPNPMYGSWERVPPR